MAYYYTMYNGAQRLAAYFGQWGLTAGIEYRRLLELERTI
jgi:hypothetical protein